MPRTRTLILALAFALALAAPATADAAKPKRLHVALGDSYATGYQVISPGVKRNTRNGYAYQVQKLARKRGHDFKLVNFGCAAATTTSLLERRTECPGPAPGGPDYAGKTQIAAAEKFLRAKRGKVGLITVSIGGNDVTSCAAAPEPIPCVVEAVEAIRENVTEIAERLREAGGKKPRIVGITYPDVILGQWVGEGANQDLARLSVTAFKDFINPTLEKAYEAAGGRLVDVTAATGAYGSLDETTTLEPYGVIPVPVATVCELSYYCDHRDIHLRTKGYRLIAELIAKTLPRR
jgi:lysophospholipase L1-like esterase